jgi:hypothetical protein
VTVSFGVSMSECVSVRVCARVCMLACARARGCVCVCVCVGLCGFMCLCDCVCVCSERVCAMPRRCSRTLVVRRRLAVFIARPAPRRSFVEVRARSAAGASWSCRTKTAPWAGRVGHTSVVDAAGTIYVIGGRNDTDTVFNDVWASTDGGARPDAGVGRSGVLQGVLQGGTRGAVWGMPTGFRARISDHSPVPLSLRRGTCKCSRRYYHMVGVHASRTRTVCASIRAGRARPRVCRCVCACAHACACAPLGPSVCACVRSVCERTVRVCVRLAAARALPSHGSDV